ncbi:MAG: hypothetical protein ABIV26_03910 [Candidatus Limnocylindrales bacterium]
MHVVAAMLAQQHLDDLLREAEAERRSRLVRGARRSAWSTFRIRARHVARQIARRGTHSGSGRPDSIRPASVQA